MLIAVEHCLGPGSLLLLLITSLTAGGRVRAVPGHVSARGAVFSRPVYNQHRITLTRVGRSCSSCGIRRIHHIHHRRRSVRLWVQCSRGRCVLHRRLLHNHNKRAAHMLLKVKQGPATHSCSSFGRHHRRHHRSWTAVLVDHSHGSCD